MIVLCSNGLSSKAVMEKMKEHIAGLSTAIIVVTADNEYKEKITIFHGAKMNWRN